MSRNTSVVMPTKIAADRQPWHSSLLRIFRARGCVSTCAALSAWDDRLTSGRGEECEKLTRSYFPGPQCARRRSHEDDPERKAQQRLAGFLVERLRASANVEAVVIRSFGLAQLRSIVRTELGVSYIET